MKSNKNQFFPLIDRLKKEFANDSSGHDWFHIERVWKNAELIAAGEGGDLLVIELSALLHDIADHKFFNNSDELAERRITEILTDLQFEKKTILHVIDCVNTCSFKGGHNQNPQTIEAKIVQDADRLDAIGAIGIARTFAFGGKFGNIIYDPEIQPLRFKSANHYKKSRTHTINHFYEKLLLLKDKMNTETAKRLAEQRHHFMETYLKQFYDEWSGIA